MSNATTPTTTAPIAVRFVIPISKVDKERRLVKGVATGEWLDSGGDKIDYESAKACFEKWRGNIREMHQLKAVGKSVDIEFDDEAKAVMVTSYVSKGAPDTWEKVLDGTLKDYSIGAKGIRKFAKATADSGPNVQLAMITELSLVDQGALDGTGFQIIKVDDAGGLVNAQPDEPEEQAAETETAASDTAAAAAETKPAGSDATPAQAETPAPVAKAATAEAGGFMPGFAEMRVLDRNGMCIGIARPGLDVLAAIPDASARLIKAAEIVDIQKRVESYDVRTALNCISFLEDLVSSELWESEGMGAGQTPEQKAQVELLRNASELLLAFLIGEFMAQFDDATKAAVTKAESDAVRLTVLKTIGTAAASRLRAGHTLESIAKALSASTLVIAPPVVGELVTVDLVKLQDALTATQAQLTKAEGTIQKQQESLEGLTDLQARMKRLEDSPAPGGPVTREVPGGTAVTKAIGGEPAGPVNHGEVVHVLTELAKSAATPQERERISQELLRYQFKHGLGGSVVTR